MVETAGQCPRCGTSLDAAAMGGLCPRCVALDFLTPTDFDAGPAPTEVVEILADEEKRFGDYEVLDELGRGGMGVVYRARQLSLGREVAVKFLLHGVLAGDAALARFRAEAEAVAGLRHPNIVTIYEVGDARGRSFFSMELVRGRTLSELLREGPWAAPRAAGCLRQVAEALHYAHERGVLHRDLKPANVLIDERDEPRVTDFGLAKRANSSNELTLSGQVLGTPAYISPEQAGASRELDARSDVYSLGALLYHLIAGRPPFVGESPSTILRQVAETEPISPRLLNPAVPRDLETICLKCLEKEPSRRYVTAAELAEDLGRFLRDEPIRARPVSGAERAWRWCKRRPALAASLTGMAILLVSVAVVSNAAARRIEVLRLDALTNLYSSDMRLTQQAIAESKFGAAVELLDRHRPRAGDPDLRGFEWWHFQERCSSEEAAALEAHRSQVQRAVFSPDGRLFATAATDVQVWESDGRRLLWRHQTEDFVWALAFSPDGKDLLAGVGNGSVLRFDVGPSARLASDATSPSPARLLAAITNLPARPIAFTWSAEAPAIRIVLPDGVLAWDGVSARPDRVARLGDAFTRVQVTPDGSLAAVLSGPNRVGAWRIDPPSLMQEFHLPVISRTAAISADGRRLAAGDYSGALRIWELTSEGRTNVVLAHRGLIECAVFSPDGARLASAGADQIIRLHEAGTGTLLGEWQGHRATIMALAFSPDGQWLVSGDKLGAVKLWSLQARPRMAATPFAGGTTLSADGARVVTWNSATSIVIRSSSAVLETGSMQPVPDKSWILPSAEAVVAIDAEGKLRALEADGRWREHSLGGLAASRGGALSQDGRFAALRVKGINRPFVWDLAEAREALRITNEQTWLAPTFSADSRRVACGSARGRVHVWELPSGREVASFLAHRNYAYDCDLSPDGKRLATAGFDGLVKLWDVDGARLLGEYHSTADAYWTVALAPDGRRIAAGTSESSVVLWDVPSRQEVATFQLRGPLGPAEGRLRFTPDGTALLHANGALHQWSAPRPGTGSF